MSHPFGDLLRQYRARKSHLTQTRLAELAGYDQAVLVRMSQSKKDLTGPSGRERVIRIIAVLREEGVLTTQAEANALLKAAGVSPLYEGQPAEQALLKVLRVDTPMETSPAMMQNGAQPKSNLPAQLTSFIGRESEIVEVQRLLRTTRLLTLTGSGGAGKTRLAIEVGMAEQVGYRIRKGQPQGIAHPMPARTAIDQLHYDAVWMVEFASLTTPDLVAETVAASLGLQVMSRTALAVLTDHLSDLNMLLILDNCEHLIDACARLAVTLLQDCSHLTMLVTSREPLNIPGEVTWRVPPLRADTAVRLFAKRACEVKPDFELTAENTPMVAHICTRLDGMPLALELAAARLRAFTVGDIARRLDDVFRMLTGGSRVALPRQQTLLATIEWSYALLTGEERTLFREVSIFTGGWTLEAAEAIHGADTPEMLEQLVNKSLVVAEERPAGMRYHLLETIRQYARDRLAEAGAEHSVRQRHLDYFVGLEQRALPHLSGGGPRRKWWVDTLVPEVDNLRAALDWVAQREDRQSFYDLLACMLAVWCEPGCTTRGSISEASYWLNLLVFTNAAAGDRVRVAALYMMANIMGGGGDMIGYAHWLRQASALAHRIEDDRMVLELDARLGAVTPDHSEAAELLTNVLHHARRYGLKRDEIHAITGLGARMILQGNGRQAVELLEQGAATARQFGIDSSQTQAWNDLLGHILWRLGRAYQECDDYAQARRALEVSIALQRGLGSTDAEPMVDLGVIGVYTGDYTIARQAIREGFVDVYNRDNQERIAQTMVLAAGLAHVLERPLQAARLLGAAAAIRRDHHTHGVFEVELFAEYDRRLPAVQAALAPAEFEQVWTEGMKLTVRAAMAEALTI